MAIQKLITATEVISIAFNDSNLIEAKIKDSYIEIAQEKYIRQLFGNEFYEEVLENYDTGDYADLVTQLKPCLAYYVKYLALPELIVKITNKGAALSTSGTTEQLDAKGRGSVRANALDMGDSYAQVATRWIEHEDQDNKFDNYYKFNNVKNRTSRRGGFVFRNKY